jgi:dihydroorotase
MATPSQPCAAGVYTAPILLPLVAHLLESFGALDKLVSFSSSNGRAFYKVEAQNLRSVTLRKEPFRIMESLSLKGDDVAPFWAGKELDWSIASGGALP